MSVNYAQILPPIVAGPEKSSNNITFIVNQLDAKESSKVWTNDIEDVTAIRTNSPGTMANVKPLTLHTVFKEAVDRCPRHIAMKYKFSHEEKCISMTFEEYYRLCCMAAKSFIKMGLEPRSPVCIAGYNSPPWHISFIGTIFAGGVASGVYTTNTDETISYILKNCSCRVAIVEDQHLLKRYMKASKEAPKLKAIIQFLGVIDPALKQTASVGLYEWEEFMTLGLDVSDKQLVQRIQSLIPNQCCSVIYTSGTTGNPKGVMMSHDNLTWTAMCCVHHLGFRQLREELVSYLPLSHVAAQMCDIIMPLICNATVWFAQPDSLRGTLGMTLKEARPTLFIGVPRVWEKIAETMQEIGLATSPIKKKIAGWAKDVGLRTHLALMNKEPTPYSYILAKHLVFKKVRAGMGFDRCARLYSAAAPISTDILHYFASLDLLICEIYGMSECSGPHFVGFKDEFVFGSVGKPFPEFSNKIDSKEGDEPNVGEVCMRGRHVFMGYLGANDATKESFDEEDWLHSGDIGTINKDGYLFITGRIKELLITAGGENIAPVPIEERMKENLPFVSNAFLIGDKRKFLSILLTIKCEINLATQYPTDTLSPVARRWFRKHNYNAENVSQIINEQNPLVWAAIDDAIKTANASAVSKASFIQKWKFLPCDFSVGGGELGPTMKVKRGVVVQMYSNLIDSLYESQTTTSS